MTQNFIRDCTLEVAGIKIRGGGNDDLRVRFEVHQNDRATPNYANLVVTNLSDNTTQKIMTAGAQASVSLTAGYNGLTGLIFKGQIQQVRSGQDLDAITDTYTHVLARDMAVAHDYAVVNSTLKAGHTFRDRVNLAVKAYEEHGVKVGYIVDLPGRKSLGPYTAVGMARRVLREVAVATATTWSVQNGTFQMTGIGQPVKGPKAVVLNSGTGLVGRPTQTLRGIEGRCFINPNIRPGTLVQIDEKSIEQFTQSPQYGAEGQTALVPRTATDGFYTIYVVNHEGDTRGGPWYTEFVGIRQGDPVSKALAAQGFGELPFVERGVGTGVPGDDAPATANPNGAFKDASIKAGPR